MAGFVTHGRDGLLCPEEFAGLLAINHHSLEGKTVSELSPHLPVEFRVMQTRLQNSRSFAQSFVPAVSGCGLEGWIHVLDDALRVGEDDAVGGLFDDPRKQNKALQRIAALGEIVEHHDSSGNHSGRVFQGPRVYPDPNSGTRLRVAHENKLVDNLFSANGANQGQLIRWHD